MIVYMDLNKVLFRPVRETLDEALSSVVSFDDVYELVDYLMSAFNCVPFMEYEGLDDRINWDTYIVLDNKSWQPLGRAHIPKNLSSLWCN